jgi:hypothetical protein
MIRTITRMSGFRSAPPRNARIRRPTPPGPHAPRRRSQYGSVKNGQKSTDSRNTAQRAIGDMITARRGMSRVETRATPKKTRSTPTPIHRSTPVVPSPGTKSPYRRAANPSAMETSAPTARCGKSAHPKSVRSRPRTASRMLTSVFPGVVVIAVAPTITPIAVIATARKTPRTRSSGSSVSTAPSRTAAIGGTVVARRPG